MHLVPEYHKQIHYILPLDFTRSAASVSEHTQVTLLY